MPQQLPTDVRLAVLDLAVRHHAGSETGTDRALVATATALEAHLGTVATAATRPPTAQDILDGPNRAPADAEEMMRIRVESLPLDGTIKRLLPNVELAYRIETLARLMLTDPNESAANKQAALDELRATVNDLVDFLADGAE